MAAIFDQCQTCMSFKCPRNYLSVLCFYFRSSSSDDFEDGKKEQADSRSEQSVGELITPFHSASSNPDIAQRKTMPLA